MADGTIEVDLEVNGDKAVKQATKAAQSAANSAESTMKGAANAVGGFASGIVSASTKALAAIGAAGTAVTGLIAKGALEEFSSYQQNIGGIQKLFGDSWQTVQGYAADAWKTAQISSNEYMEQVTSFSASLINSLGGDTQRAAEYADRAIRDMSDNANTFGTNIRDIQNAYQGFAKQNYTMLDNLKLGYGGTQQEMQRLIKDAAAMKDVQKELGVTVDANSMSFDNIVNAIDVMQNHMGIAGTSMKEALKTVEGSVNATKSAWKNWLEGLADDSQDIGRLTDNLLTAFSALAANVLPRITKIIETIVTKAPSMLQQIGEALAENVLPMLDTLLEYIKTYLPVVIAGIVTWLRENFPTMFTNIIEGIIANLPWFFDMLLQLLLGIVDVAGDAIAILIEHLPEFLATIWETIKAHGPEMLQAAAEFFGKILLALVEALPGILLQLLTMIGDICGGVAGGVGDMIMSAAQFFGGLLTGLATIVGQVIGAVAGFVGQVASYIAGSAGRLWTAGYNFFVGLWNGIVSCWNRLWGIVSSFPGRIINAFSGAWTWLYNAGWNIMVGLWNGLVDKWNEMTGWISGIGSWIQRHKGPLSYDRRLLIPAGKAIMGGFGKSMNEGFEDIKKRVSAYGVELQSAFDGGMSYQPSFAVAADQRLSQPVDQVINFNVPTATPDVVANRMREYAHYGLAGL